MTTERIVLGYDGSAGALAAVEWCKEHAVPLAAEVLVVGVVDVVPLIGLAPAASPSVSLSYDSIQGAMQEAVSEELEEAVASLTAAGVTCRAVVANGNPAQTLDRVAVEESAGLIVVGRRGRGGFMEMLLGSVPHTLAHHATVPVVIVPANA